MNAEIGVIGLGVMGKSLALNMAEKGFLVSVYNRTAAGEETVVADFMAANQLVPGLSGFEDTQTFIASLARPRKILLMIKAGKPVDAVINQLIPLLEEGDIILDGGNSHYSDTERRQSVLSQHSFHFLGTGISGGETGARKGPSIMPGGSAESYAYAGPVLEGIAAKDKSGKPCCTHVGPGGSGHFVKMIHNGIEYVEMQLLAEVYDLLSPQMGNEQLADVLSAWGQKDLSGYLLEITEKILRKKEGEAWLLDLILDKAGNKGTGSWSTKAAMDLGYPNTMMAAAVFARYLSSFKQKRVHRASAVKPRSSSAAFDLAKLESAYRFARLLNHHQGMELIRNASETFDWGLNLSEITRIWTNGCIIRSTLMEEMVGHLSAGESLIDQPSIFQYMDNNSSIVSEIITAGMASKTPLPVFSSAWQTWTAMTTDRLPANLIQAQRDYFGAHTYQRVDRPEAEFFHTKWEKDA